MFKLSDEGALKEIKKLLKTFRIFLVSLIFILKFLLSLYGITQRLSFFRDTRMCLPLPSDNFLTTKFGTSIFRNVSPLPVFRNII